MDDLLSTPIARAGPTSRLLKRQSVGPADAAKMSKERNLERSLQLLDEAIDSPSLKYKGNPNLTMDITRVLDISRPVDYNPRLGGAASNTSLTMDNTRYLGGDITRPFNMGEDTLSMTMSTALQEESPGVKGTENLFDEFLATITGGDTGVGALDSIAEFEQMVGDHVEALRRVIANVPSARDKFPKTWKVLEDLTNERNTWRLMGKLYNDRLVTSQRTDPELQGPAQSAHTSEKQIIERLFRSNASVRQAYMVVQWLENNAHNQLDEVITQQMQWFSDATVGWENTLAALTRNKAGPNIVTELDPDAPYRTGKQLHDLDQEDDLRLLRCMYGLIRCGQLEEAQELCVRLGQPWRAATLEGWRLFHDPNYDSGRNSGGGSSRKLPTEGNPHRDVWKQGAWCLTQDKSVLQHERAVYAALCGNLKVLQSVCTNWEDLVWAGAKCAVDLMVETEIRDTMVKSFVPLPTEYWNTPQTLSKVLSEVNGMGGKISQEGSTPYHTIQSYLIMDDWPGLVSAMTTWLSSPATLEPHLLRFATHLILVHRALGIPGGREGEEEVLRTYTEYLIKTDRLMLIPWYVSRLKTEVQLPLFSQFLAGVREAEDQALCLHLGGEVGLDMAAITVAAVASVRQEENPDKEQMVDSLGWLVHNSSQAVDLLTQTNAVIRKLLAAGQLELAGRAAARVPADTMARVARAWREEEEEAEQDLPALPGGCVREHLALQVYLSAQEAFSDWFDHFHRGRPKRPQLPANPSFTDKVAHEQKEKQYTAELDRWKGGQLIQSRQTEEKLREVLTFPGGWLLPTDDHSAADVTGASTTNNDDSTMMESSDDNVVDAERRVELEQLRSEFLPQTVLLLHSVLHNTGQYKACLALADIVASDTYRLSTAYSKQQMRELLKKLRESSVAALEKGTDAWGYPKP